MCIRDSPGGLPESRRPVPRGNRNRRAGKHPPGPACGRKCIPQRGTSAGDDDARADGGGFFAMNNYRRDCLETGGSFCIFIKFF